MTAPRMGVLGDMSKVGQRDAFHVPVVTVTATKDVFPGERMVFSSSGQVRHIEIGEKAQAIADPWLKNAVRPGEPFFVMVAPELVGDLVHHFHIEGVQSVVDGEIEKIVAKRVADARDEWENDYECRDCY